MKKTVQSVNQVVEYFKHYDSPVVFIGTIYGTALLNLYPFIPQFQIITCSDPYCGTYPYIKIPQFVKKESHKCRIMADQFCTIALISNPQVLTYLKSKKVSPKIIFKTPHPVLERICKQNDFQLWCCPFESYYNLGNKIGIIDILRNVQVPVIPNLCSTIKSYQHLKQITGIFGSDRLVVQDQVTSGGFGTMFIDCEADYLAYQSTLQNGNVFKIMKRRQLKCFAIVGVATSKGVIFGPLVSQLIGYPNLTKYQGGYCGNQIRSSYFEDRDLDLQIRRKIYQYTERFISHLYSQGLFKGSFGCDYSVDMETNQIFFMEINPRLTGSTCLSFELYEAQGLKFPIYLYHCLEHIGLRIQFDIESLNKQWICLDHYQDEYSHIIVRAFDPEQACIPLTFPAGIWKIQNGVPKPTGKIDFRLKVLQEDQIIVIPGRGIFKLTLLFKGNIQDLSFKLLPKYNSIINQVIAYRLKDKPSK